MELVHAVRNFITLEHNLAIDFIRSKEGFEKRRLLNATPISHLVRIHTATIN
jgi:hypothetical protein